MSTFIWFEIKIKIIVCQWQQQQQQQQYHEKKKYWAQFIMMILLTVQPIPANCATGSLGYSVIPICLFIYLFTSNNLSAQNPPPHLTITRSLPHSQRSKILWQCYALHQFGWLNSLCRKIKRNSKPNSTVQIIPD